MDGSSATTAPLHGPLQPCCMASHAACCTCGLMVVADVAAARIAAGEEVGEPPAEQPLVGAVEDRVLGALEAGAGVPQRVEAGDRRVGQRVRVHPQEPEVPVGRRRVGQQLAARRDLAALAGVLVEQHALVARVGAQAVGGEHLGQRGVGQQQHDQRHDRDGDAAQGGVHTLPITSVLAAAIGVAFGPARGRAGGARRARCGSGSPAARSWRAATSRRRTSTGWSARSAGSAW